jgi:hypothetical protein
MMMPRLVASLTSRFDSSSIFFTDGSKGGAGVGFGVYHSGGPESGFRLREPSGEVGDFSGFDSGLVVLLEGCSKDSLIGI